MLLNLNQVNANVKKAIIVVKSILGYYKTTRESDNLASYPGFPHPDLISQLRAGRGTPGYEAMITCSCSSYNDHTMYMLH